LLGISEVAIVKYRNDLIIQGTAMSLLSGNDLKEKQKINELELKINREKQKLNKKLTRQKILLGAFLVDALENNSVDGLREYTADHLLGFLTKESDKELMKDFVVNLGGVVTVEKMNNVSNIDK